MSLKIFEQEQQHLDNQSIQRSSIEGTRRRRRRRTSGYKLHFIEFLTREPT